MQDTLRQPLRRVDRIANVPLYVTSSVPINESKGSARNASSLLIGDFGQVYLGVRTEMRVQVLSELYGAKAQIGFRLWFRGDVLVARPSSLCRISGIIPAS